MGWKIPYLRFEQRSSLSSNSTIFLPHRLEAYPCEFWLVPIPDSLEGRNEIDQHFKTLNVLQGRTLSTEAITGKVGTLIISPAGNEGDEINKQAIIVIRYQRFILGHTPIKTNFNAVRSNVMNLRYFFLMSNSCWDEACSLWAPYECPCNFSTFSFLVISKQAWNRAICLPLP